MNTETVKTLLTTIPFISEVYYINDKDSIIDGKVGIFFDGLDKELQFIFNIYPPYPLKHHKSESIRFFNENLLELNHIMEDGSVCIHNSHNTDFKQKLLIDFDSLKQWIEKYYINKDKDIHYEHIIVSESLIDENYYSYIFTNVHYPFSKGDFGKVKISHLYNTFFKEKPIQNFLVQSFVIDGVDISCKWNSYYKSMKKQDLGLFYFLDEHPAKYNKFIYDNWQDFNRLISQEFLNFLYEFGIKNQKKHQNTLLPIFLGYKTIDNEIHWQVALIKFGNCPIVGKPEILLGVKTGRWNTNLIDSKIQWGLTRDSSDKYFFGRGTLDKSIIDKRILIMGIGAIGSIVAKTLTRGGCKSIDIVEYDVKEPENVCRSEYMFQFGLSDKVSELQSILFAISPFIEVNILKKEYFEFIIKTFYKDVDAKKHLITNINEYDIVFDCTTDNDLMNILDSLDTEPEIINLSITNHANELVCAFSLNIYHFVNSQFENVLDNDIEDLYEPTGCWSPTFKASYNDINTLVQFAIKHINTLYSEGKKRNNFIITTSDDNLQLEIKEY